MKQNTKRLSSMILALLLLVAALIVYFDFAAPAYSDLQTEKGEQVSQENLLENEKQIVSQVQALVTSYQSQADGQQQVSRALPVGPDIAGALAQIYGAAANDTLNIQDVGIANNPPQISQGGGSDINAAASGGNIVKPIGSVSFTVTASGNYESFKNFLRHMETNSRIMDVRSISIHPVATVAVKGVTPNQNFFNYTMTVVAYYESQ